MNIIKLCVPIVISAELMQIFWGFTMGPVGSTCKKTLDLKRDKVG